MSFETALTGESATFEDATREYPGGAGRPARSLLRELPIPAVPTRPAISAMPIAADPSDFVPEVTPAFGSAADLQTPPGFGTEVTEMRRRDLGFVQPSGEARGDRSGRVSGPPELKMTLRTPGALTLPPVAPPPQAVEPPRAPKLPAELDRHRTPTANGEPSEDRAAVEPPRADELALQLEASSPSSGYISLEIELTPVPDPSALDLIGRVDTRPAPPPAGALTPADEAVAESAANTVDLIMSLPTPRPPTTLTRQIPVPVRSRLSPESRPPGERPTGELSAELALPLAVGTAPTQELSLALKLDPQRTVHSEPAPTREFPAKPTPPRPPRPDDPLISAPTRDLGLRAASRPVSEDETTRELEVQKPRKPRGTVKPELPAMDPIDARSAEILEEIDRNAPANEVREDRTRRRITALLDRATSWSASAEHERSVTAVDLALSEDPNSALAQKLIHRNREVIMNAFQAFLGDLQRTPSLARPLHELASAPISPRAAFLLSRVDGTLSLDEILDVSGMPRLEAYRYLCQLFLRGILR
jgi:hypothetical protein